MRMRAVLVIAAGLAVALGGCSFSSESKVETSVSTEVTDEETGEQDTASSEDELYDFAVGTVSDVTYTRTSVSPTWEATSTLTPTPRSTSTPSVKTPSTPSKTPRSSGSRALMSLGTTRSRCSFSRLTMAPAP